MADPAITISITYPINCRTPGPDGPRYPRRDPPPSSATAMHVTAIQVETERNRLNRSARCAEKHRRRAGMLRVWGPIRTTSGVCATTVAARGVKRLINWRSQAIFTLEGRPLGECRLTFHLMDRSHRLPTKTIKPLASLNTKSNQLSAFHFKISIYLISACFKEPFPDCRRVIISDHI